MKHYTRPVSLIAVTFTVGLLLMATMGAGSNELPKPAQFALEVEGKIEGFFTSISSIGSTHEVIEMMIITPQGEEIVQPVPGRLSWSAVTLERGLSPDMYLAEWRQQVIDGDFMNARTDCTVIALDRRNYEIGRWDLDNAWPSQLHSPVSDDPAVASMVESIVLVHEGMIRVY